jgi:hypothetical protein
VVSIKSGNRSRGLDITPEALPPLWRGEQMDDSLAILGMVSRK